MNNVRKERFLILIASVNQWYDGADITTNIDPEDMCTPDMVNAKRFDTYGEAADFIDKYLPENDMYQINKVTVKGEI